MVCVWSYPPTHCVHLTLVRESYRSAFEDDGEASRHWLVPTQRMFTLPEYLQTQYKALLYNTVQICMGGLGSVNISAHPLSTPLLLETRCEGESLPTVE